ncbi:MAG: DUF5597 domain-containing protein [Prevotella sp.]
MKRILLLTALLAVIPFAVNAQVRLASRGTRAHIEIDGKPMLILGGELSNSAATCREDIAAVMPRMRATGMNTVLVPAQWDLLEPVEGEYDFSLIDETIMRARENGLKVIFLWFGAWKNSMSCYAPLWFKRDTRRFPRAMTRSGKPLEIASAFSESVFQADRRAFMALIGHIAGIDKDEHTVIMIQVENEIGMLEDARDHSTMAERCYHSAVPDAMLKTLGARRGETWGDVLTHDAYGDEQFMAYWYGRYVERLAVEAKAVLDIPMYVNAAMNSRGRRPGEYPSAGPLAHLKDIWHIAAPHIDILAPDIYDTGFKQWTERYAMKDNPLFIPESRCCQNSGARALYTMGEHEAVGFSPFAIDQASPNDISEVRRAYGMISELSPLLMAHRATGRVRGVLLDADDRETVIGDGQTILTCRHYLTLPWDPRSKDGSPWREGGAIVIRTAPGEYVIAGSGIVVDFKARTEKEQEERAVLGEDGFADKGGGKTQAAARRFKGKRKGIGAVDEVSVNRDGTLTYIRRHNGDQSHQGRHARISVDDYKILRVTLYEY